MTLIKKIILLIVSPFLFILGYFYFSISGKTIPLSYAALRVLFVNTNGIINDLMSKLISFFHPYNEINAKSFMADYSSSDLDQIVSEIRKNGYYEFNFSLGEEDLKDLMHFGENTSVRVLDINRKHVGYLPEKQLIDFSNVISPRYQFEADDVLGNKTVQKIIFDSFFLNLAGKYLNCSPILDIITMWWSFPFKGKGTSQAAQMYHFDMDRIKFLKFFFYLTDVHEENGPHCYVRGSHNHIPSRIRKDQRITDEEILNHFPKDHVKEFCGKKGTILAVDTRGLHKGKPLTEGKRLLFQIQFSNALFGAPYKGVNTQVGNHAYRELIRDNRRTFQLLTPIN